ncbi:60S ribosomal protein L29-like [Eptesicus fuscus]|uniref:60S ribosomal protein L29-like n=1 Tax=Eptesicus fuscus TaxID=29078 RepID=UPI0024043DBF|nr:60S ribosomal protein L29-like [Eptesicus fuscus]
MAKSRNHTMHNQFRKWHRNGIKKEIDPKFLGNIHFAKKHKKRHINTNAMSTCAKATKAFIKPTEVKPEIPKGGSCKLSQLVYIIHPKLGKCAWVPITEGLGYCWPKAKATLKPSLRLQLQLRLRLPQVPRPP